MIADDDDDDGLLFDEPDETEAGYQPTNVLVVGAVPPKELLCSLEERYRREGLPPVIFEEFDETTGQSIFGNALEYARLMNLDVEPSIDEAIAWIASRRWASLEW